MKDDDLLPCPNCGTRFTLEMQQRAIRDLQKEKDKQRRARRKPPPGGILIADGLDGLWRTDNEIAPSDLEVWISNIETCGDCGTLYRPRAKIIVKQQGAEIDRLRNEVHPPLRRLADAAEHDSLTGL